LRLLNTRTSSNFLVRSGQRRVHVGGLRRPRTERNSLEHVLSNFVSPKGLNRAWDMGKRFSRQYVAYLFGFLFVLSVSDPGKRRVALCDVQREPSSKYKVLRVTGDGSCLFRSVAAGYAILKGQFDAQNHENVSRSLRQRVVEELKKREDEIKWYIEGDFDTYVSNMKNQNVWGGETELLMLTHVLKHPITVYMQDEKKINGEDSLKLIAEYGKEYGQYSEGRSMDSACASPDPIRVLYHGYGHYELMLPSIISSSRSNEWLPSKL